jgi:hypothetical protein
MVLKGILPEFEIGKGHPTLFFPNSSLIFSAKPTDKILTTEVVDDALRFDSFP